MSVATLTSRGQVTIPKRVRKALNFETNDKITFIVKNNMAIIKPQKGNILDIGASIKIPGNESPINFKKV